VRLPIGFGRITPAIDTFQGGESLIFLQIGQFKEVDESCVYLERTKSVLDAKNLPLCFFVRLELHFERNTSCKSYFSKWRKDHFAPNRPIPLRRCNTWTSQKETFCDASICS
jgi:hypothetical protein